MGLIAACDIAVAAEEAMFSISEVRIGLVPSTISPYVIAAIGAQAARRYFLTGEAFSAAEAHRLRLLHQVVPGSGLDAAIDSVIASHHGGVTPSILAQAMSRDHVPCGRGMPSRMRSRSTLSPRSPAR